MNLEICQSISLSPPVAMSEDADCEVSLNLAEMCKCDGSIYCISWDSDPLHNPPMVLGNGSNKKLWESERQSSAGQIPPVDLGGAFWTTGPLLQAVSHKAVPFSPCPPQLAGEQKLLEKDHINIPAPPDESFSKSHSGVPSGVVSDYFKLNCNFTLDMIPYDGTRPIAGLRKYRGSELGSLQSRYSGLSDLVGIG